MQIASVTALVLNFADACRALVPMLDGAAVPWADGEKHDNWDRIAEPLFETLVTEPCAFAAVGEGNRHRLQVARYDFMPSPADCNAYVALEGDEPKRMVGLASLKRPFDMAAIMGADGLEKLPLTECRFVFVFPEVDGKQQRLSEVDLDAE